MNTLEADSIILHFGTKRVLSDIYLKCETGKITGLLGRNGSGKTCLMDILFGVLEPVSKSIRINGVPVYGSYRDPAEFRLLPQLRFIPNRLTIQRVFKDFEQDFQSFITLFPEFSEYYHSRFSHLASGNRRIIEIYLILVSNTKFCLLDEPFTELMPLYIERIKKLILREKEKKGFIITDHLYRHVLDLCDQIYLVEHGATHFIKDPEDLKHYGYVSENAVL